MGFDHFWRENWKLDIQINIILSGFYKKKTIESDSLFIALLALLKKGDESESLLLLFKKEQFALHRSSKMSDESDSLLSLFLKEQFALVALYKKSSFKKKWFARKTKERIPIPAQSSWIWIHYQVLLVMTWGRSHMERNVTKFSLPSITGRITTSLKKMWYSYQLLTHYWSIFPIL